MKKICFMAIVAILLSGSHTIIAQKSVDKKSVTGSWMGKISTGEVQLRVVFNLSIIEKDSLVATLDSPDQGAKNIKLGPVTLKDKNIKISAGALMAEYNGIIKDNTTIEGTWVQGGQTFALNLKKNQK